jgi:phenylalanine-4-hydroxylase
MKMRGVGMVLEQQYTREDHEVWKQLYARMWPRWERYANEFYLKGVRSLCFEPDRIPELESVNRFLCPLTGFRAKAVGGYLPAFLFFDCLRNREFPTVVSIREASRLDYLPEPDIFHDIAGHVPMHTDPAFAEALVRVGECAHTAAERAAGVRNEAVRLARLNSMITAMARFFWFTVEFG